MEEDFPSNILFRFSQVFLESQPQPTELTYALRKSNYALVSNFVIQDSNPKIEFLKTPNKKHFNCLGSELILLFDLRYVSNLH